MTFSWLKWIEMSSQAENKTGLIDSAKWNVEFNGKQTKIRNQGVVTVAARKTDSKSLHQLIDGRAVS